MTDPNFDIKFLYLTPERISHSKAFLDALDAVYRNGNLLRIAIDEAHCISEWGHDFRPSYRQLSVFAKRYPGVPIVAVTGTLTPTVRADIMQQLGVESSAYVLQASFNRTNLWLEVLPRSEEGMSELYNYIINTELTEKTGIIYCMTCREAEELADFLRSKELKAAYYHGSLSSSVRSKTQGEWMSGQVKVICTTIAFGLGIDKPDVRYVLHATMPASLEAYYQQVGRAGRDQQLSGCAMFYNHKDIYRLKNLIKMGSEEAAQRRALSAEMNTSAESAAAMRLMRKKKKLKMALLDDEGHRVISEEEREAQSIAKAEGRHANGDDNELTEEDINQELTIFKEDKLDDILKFCLDVNQCRRTQLLAYFGEHFDAAYCNDTCDVCYRKKLIRDAKGDSVEQPKLKRLSRKFATIDPLLQRTLPPAKYQQLRLKAMEEGVTLPQIVAEPSRPAKVSSISRTDGSMDAAISDLSPIQRADAVVHDAISPSIPKLVQAGAGKGPTRVAEIEARKEAAIKELSSDPLKRKAMMGEIRKMSRDLRQKQKDSNASTPPADDEHQDQLGGHQDPAAGLSAEIDEKNDAPEDDPDAVAVDPRRAQMVAKSLKHRERQEEKMKIVRQQQMAVSSSSGSAISRQLYQICEEEARERNVTPRDVLSHVAIKEVIRVRPKSMSQLAAIKGVGARKANAIFERVLPLFNNEDD
jgi:superfamily II DNA helicase RecQ